MTHHKHHSDVQQMNQSGHGRHDHHVQMLSCFKQRLWVSLVLTVPILALSPATGVLAGLDELSEIPRGFYPSIILTLVVISRLHNLEAARPRGGVGNTCRVTKHLTKKY